MTRKVSHTMMAALVATGLLATGIPGAGITGTAHAQSALKNHDTYQPLDITAERLEMKQKEGRAIFKGAVKVKQGELTLTADSLTVFYKTKEGAANPAVSRLNAQGDVKLTSSTETLSGDWGIYDVDRRMVTLGGHVIFTQGESTLKGDRLEFNLVTGLAKLDGNDASGGQVRGRFSVPTKDEGDKKDPPKDR